MVFNNYFYLTNILRPFATKKERKKEGKKKKKELLTLVRPGGCSFEVFFLNLTFFPKQRVANGFM